MATRAGAGVPTGDEADGTDEVADLFRALGRQIKVARVRAGMSQKELGDRLGYGEETVSSVERGRRTPQPELLVAVDKLLGCGGLLAAAAEDVERARARRRVRHPEWFRDYARLEAEAVQLCYFANQAVPGLFQTKDYARAVFASRQPLFDEETIELRVTARLARQEPGRCGRGRHPGGAAGRRADLRASALRWRCRDVPSVVCGTVVASRAVPRAPSGRCRTAADFVRPA